ncbi:MAG: hypothetical protein HKM07_03875 [Chlamydiae bacterium]|nr:hypothetical protein [Chlamydiota bacterium]
MQSTAAGSSYISIFNRNLGESLEVFRFSDQGKILFLSDPLKQFIRDDFQGKIPIPPNNIEGLSETREVSLPPEHATEEQEFLFVLAFTKIFYPKYLEGHGYFWETRKVEQETSEK